MWTTIFVQPLYNLVIIITNMSGGYLAIGIVGVILLVKILLYPFAYRALKSQLLQKKLQPEVQKLRDTITDKTAQAAALMELYKKHNAHPLSGCFPALIQIPIIIALYQVFFKGIDTLQNLLYTGVQFPAVLHQNLFIFNLNEPSTVLAVIAAIVQFAQIRLTASLTQQDTGTAEGAMAANMMKFTQILVPVMILVVALKLPSVVAWYIVVTALVSMLQDLYIHKTLTLDNREREYRSLQSNQSKTR